MRGRTPILDYAPPAHSRAHRIFFYMSKIAVDLQWFFCRRPFRAIEVVIGAWLIIAVTYAYFAAHRFDLSDNSFKPVIALNLTAILISSVAFFRLAAQRRWRAILLLCIVAAPTGVIAGMLQVERCPHASYIQVLGFSFTFAGERCGNPRKIEPWWLRE